MQQNLSSIYESMKSGGNDLDDKNPSPLIDGGAKEEGGFHKSLNDTYNELYDEDEEDEGDDDGCECEGECECAEEEDEEVIVKESKKISKPALNTNMARKSAFDKLYETVIKENFGMEDNEDLDALGLGDATPDSDLEDDFGGEDEDGGEDSVTFTLDRGTAQALVDVLQGVLGEEGDDELDFGDEEDDGFGGDDEDGFVGDEEDNEEEDDDEYEEDEERSETKTAPDAKGKYQSKGSAKVKGKVKPKSGKASSDVTDKQGNDGDFGNAISGGKKPNMGEGGSAKVSNLKASSDFFK